MLPSSPPGSRSAPEKWPKMAALLCFLSRCLQPKRLARNVSRPEASTTNLVCQVRSAPSSCRTLTSAPSGTEVHLRHAAALDRARALAHRIAEQDVVELRAAHLVGGRIGLVPCIREIEHRRPVVPGRHELHAILRHADGLDFLGHAQALEQLQVQRQQRFADVEARMTRFFEQHDVASLLREQGGDRRPGGAATDHQDFASGLSRHTAPS